MRSTRWPRRRTSRSPLGAVVTLVAIALLAPLVALLMPPVAQLSGRAQAADGDSLRIGDTRIRLVGFDAVELDQTCLRNGTEWPCGREARQFLRSLTDRHDVTCTAEGRDKYRRTLARCRTADAGDLGDAIVRAGWAVADLEYAVALAEARLNARGIWSGTFEDPARWRQTQGEPEPSFWDWLLGLVGR